jgi:hypothetical protein
VIEDNLTLYALWTEDARYSLTYDANGAEGSVPVDAMTYYRTERAVLLAPDSLTYEGYVFSGWSPTPEGLTTYQVGEGLEIATDITLYAQWTEVTEPVATPPATEESQTDTGSGSAGTVSGPLTTITTPSSTGSPFALFSFGERVTQEELGELAKEAGIPVLTIGDSPVPLFGIAGYAFWSVVDLLLVIAGIFYALFLVLVRRRKKDTSDTPSAALLNKTLTLLWALTCVSVLINIALFLLTQDFSAAPLVMVDIWTVPIAILLAGECTAGTLLSRRVRRMRVPEQV